MTIMQSLFVSVVKLPYSADYLIIAGGGGGGKGGGAGDGGPGGGGAGGYRAFTSQTLG